MSFDYKKYKGIPKISSIVVLIAFFLPFFLIKCNGQTLASINGVRLCVGTEVSPGGSSSSAESEVIAPKPFASIGLLAAIGGVVLAFLKFEKRNLIQVITASLGILSLFILNVNMKIALGNSASSQKMITIEMGMGYYLAFLGFLVTVIYCVMALKGDKQSTVPLLEEELVDDE